MGEGLRGEGGESRGPRGYRKLKAFEACDDAAVAVVTLSRKIDRDFRWLAVQMQKSAGSVPANIVEGYARLSLREYLHHLSIDRASPAETEYWLHFATRLGLVAENQVAEVSPLIDGAGNLLYGLIRALARRLKSEGGKTNTYELRETYDGDYGKDDVDDEDHDL